MQELFKQQEAHNNMSLVSLQEKLADKDLRLSSASQAQQLSCMTMSLYKRYKPCPMTSCIPVMLLLYLCLSVFLSV